MSATRFFLKKNMTEPDPILNNLARHTARMEEQIVAYYQDPEHEREFQEWYLKKFGHSAPKDI